MIRRSLSALVATVLLAGLLPAAARSQGARDVSGAAPGARDFSGTPLAPLGAFLGTWEIDGAWADGTKLWSRNEITVGLAGKFVDVRTFARDGEGEAYERYRTVFAAGSEAGRMVSYGFTYDGTVSVVDQIAAGGDGIGAFVESRWTSGAQAIKQRIEMTADDAYRWQVWTRPAADAEAAWAAIMDGTWRRTE